MASVERTKVRNEANEKIKTLVTKNSIQEEEEESNKPGTSKSKEIDLSIELTEKEKKRQEMLKVENSTFNI